MPSSPRLTDKARQNRPRAPGSPPCRYACPASAKCPAASTAHETLCLRVDRPANCLRDRSWQLPSVSAPIENTLRRAITQQLRVNRKRQLIEFAGLERGQPLGGRNKTILLGRRNHAFRKRAEFLDVIRTFERPRARGMRVSHR